MGIIEYCIGAAGTKSSSRDCINMDHLVLGAHFQPWERTGDPPAVDLVIMIVRLLAGSLALF